MAEVIEGEVENFRKDKLAVQVLGVWYNSHFKPIEGINKGDIVKISFVEKNGFLNIRSIIVLEKAKPVIQESKLTKEISKIDTSTVNTMLMCIKEIYIENKNLTIEEITDKIIASYKKII